MRFRGRFLLTIAFAVGLFCLFASTGVYAQAVKASLVGGITDSSGAVVPGAEVTITEVDTHFTRTALTNDSGNYVFGNLDPGKYRVEVQLPGFKKAVRDNVDVLVNSTVRVDLQLQPGEVSQSIEVVATTPTLQTDRADVGRKIETRQIEDMPLLMNRNFQGLLNLVPGTTPVFRPHSEFFNSQDSLSTEVNGQGRYANNVQFEGIDNNHRTGLLTALIPPIEALQTVDVTTSNYEAELGRAGGAVVNIALKSGTNNFHGSLFEFNRISATGARNFFASVKPVTVFNLFGGTIGGPIVKDRTFFFFDYQGIRDRRGDDTIVTIPTMDFRGGNFSAASTTIYDPSTGNPDGTGRKPFPGNIIPENRISPIAKRILALIPPPNRAGFSSNFEKATVRKKDIDSFDTKIDHKFNDTNTLAFRYSFQKPTVFDPSLYPVFGGPKAGGFAGTGVQRAQNGAVNYTHIFNPRFITELRFGVMRYRNDAKNEDSGRKTSDELGIPGVNLDDFTSGITGININGYSNPIIGFSASQPWVRAETNVDLVSNWTRVVGNHTVKWGADVRRNLDDLLQTQTFSPRGLFTFNPGPAALNGNTNSGFANAFATFLLDLPNSFGRDLPGIFPTFRQTQLFTYFQDKWALTPKLTVDLGLRHELFMPPKPAMRAGFSNYNPANNSLELAGVGTIPEDLGLKTDWQNWAPRAGVAYRFSEKTVIRAGFGITVDPTYPDDKWAFNFPVKQNNSFDPVNSFSAAGSMATGFPPPLLTIIPDGGIIPNAPAQVFLALSRDLRQGYVQSWNLTVQQALPWKLTFEAGYVANHAVGVLDRLNINAGVPGQGAAGQPLNKLFGRRAGTDVWTPLSSNYNSLQVKLDRRFSEGFLLTTAYTYGKAINYSDDNGGLGNHIIIRANRGRAGFDRTQSFVQNFIWELPFGPSHNWLQSGPGRWILGDWQISGVLSAYSGTPLDITISATSLNAPGNGNRPDVNGAPEILGHIGPGRKYFDVTKFAPPAPNTFGNVGRNVLSGPGYVNLNAAIFRKFPVTERVIGEFRAEGFNVPNTPHFNNPSGNFSGTSFGEVRGDQGDARKFQFALKFSF
ncbi:MAG TPA: TonB-dependent receptor [Acidobacteriota bacterium]